VARHKSVHQPRIQYDGRHLVDSHGTHRPVRVIIHETISHDAPGTLDLAGVAGFWNRQRNPNGTRAGYGSQIGVDGDGNSARYVDDHLVAWHTGGRNTGSLGIELVSMKWMDNLKWWLGRPKQMRKVAKWMAHYHKKFGIPFVWDVERGFSTHYMQSKAFPASTNHTDGQFLPKGRLMRLAKRYAREGW